MMPIRRKSDHKNLQLEFEVCISLRNRKIIK